MMFYVHAFRSVHFGEDMSCTVWLRGRLFVEMQECHEMYLIEMKRLVLIILRILMCVTHAEGDNSMPPMVMQKDHKTENYTWHNVEAGKHGCQQNQASILHNCSPPSSNWSMVAASIHYSFPS